MPRLRLLELGLSVLSSATGGPSRKQHPFDGFLAPMNHRAMLASFSGTVTVFASRRADPDCHSFVADVAMELRARHAAPSTLAVRFRSAPRSRRVEQRPGASQRAARLRDPAGRDLRTTARPVKFPPKITAAVYPVGVEASSRTEAATATKGHIVLEISRSGRAERLLLGRLRCQSARSDELCH